MTKEEAQGIASMEVVKGNPNTGDGASDDIVKIRFVDRAKYVEMAAKRFMLLTEQIRLSGSVTVIDEHASDAELWQQIEAIYNTARARMGLRPEQLIVPTLEMQNVQRAPDESKPERAAKAPVGKGTEAKRNGTLPWWSIP